MNLVWERAPYRGNTLLTLLALADWSNDEGVSWPSLETLADKSRQSIRSAQYAIEELSGDEMVMAIVNPGRGNRNEYLINTQKLHLLEQRKKVQNTTLKGAKRDTKRCKTQQRNKEEPSRSTKEPPAAPCLKCNNTGTYPHRGHPGMEVFCWCPTGQSAQQKYRSGVTS